MLRAVRRSKGWSQRELAARCGVHPRTIAAVEAATRAATVAVLDKVLAAAGLELSVDVVPPAPGPDLHRHLSRSLSERLHRATGGIGRPHRGGPPTPVWDDLLALARGSDVVLHGELARAVWFPPSAPVHRAEVCARPRQPWPRPTTRSLTVVDECDRHAAAVVAVTVEGWIVGVDPPADLALDPLHAAHRPALRTAARLLHEQAPLDLGGRRVRAHRDPAHVAEQAYVFHTKRFGQRPMPDADDRRGWRLRDDASLSAWLRRYGYPV